MDCNAYVRKSELEFYLDEPRIYRKIDLNILNLFKGNKFCYPNLSSMARDILSIRISMLHLNRFLVLAVKFLINFKVY